jgi:hypothetical protein
MTHLAEIKDVASKVAGQPARIVYVNPLNVTSVEPVHNGAKINLNDGETFTTSMGVTAVVHVIQQAMA